MFPDITTKLKSQMPELRGRMLANEPLAPLTWFRVGGPAQVLFTPADENDLAYFLRHLPEEIPIYCIGVGSNLIVRDRGLPGVVIRLSPRGFGEITTDGDTVHAGAAALDKRVAEAAATANIGGLEFYFGIPGTIGGAQGSEMHGNFLINTGEATARDLETLGETVRARVKEHAGVDLRWEIKRIGLEA
jgi:UDP-N-acetylmuramate dehydrogenase